jgi:hypothetical protein
MTEMRGFFISSTNQVDARSSTQGGGYRRKDSNGEVNDFLPKFFLVHSSDGLVVVCGCFISIRR